MIRACSIAGSGTLLILALLCQPGCGTAEDPQVLAWRQSLLLASEPTDAVTIADARNLIAEKPEVVLIGRVGVKDMPKWWSEDRALLLISEGFPGSEYNPPPDHDPKTCPFCRWKWKFEESMAKLTFVDKSGTPIPVDVRKLLKLSENDVVVIQGTGTLDDTGILNVAATGVFLKESR